ncbi:UNVERIFIED_CONTAM: hypothetical protein GTU68_019786 [Idotea baltica]|nr:hypothetical protein [Idotea baltica]
MRKAIFPGSFDPFHLGHLDILNRALPLFDEVVLALGENSTKKNLYPLNRRLNMLNTLFENEVKVSVKSYSGLTARFCEQENIKYILRGLRSGNDFDYEKSIAQLNNAISPNLDTVFFISPPQLSHVSSSIVREIMINDGDVQQFLPKIIAKMM